MRTFHTGGVFSGDVSQGIKSPFPGCIKFNTPIFGQSNRNAKGHFGILLKKEANINLIGLENLYKEFVIPAGSLLLVTNKTFVSQHQLIAELPTDSRANTNKLSVTQEILSPGQGIIHIQNGIFYLNKF